MKWAVENFGAVREHQSDKLNEHMTSMLTQFDIEYQKAGGDFNSLAYQLDKTECARLIAQSLLDYADDFDGNIEYLATETTISLGSVQSDITIQSCTAWDGREPNEQLFNRIMGYDRS